MPSWASSDTPDVLLLDINMPGLSGIEIAAFVKKHAPRMAVVFVTAEPQHALAAFEVAALDYVLKPVRAERLLVALRKVQAAGMLPSASPKGAVVLRVHDGTTFLNLALDTVLYFKSNNKTTTVRTVDKHYISTQSLLELETWLAAMPHDFVRVHRNALVRRSVAGAAHQGAEIEITVRGVSERLQVSRRMLPSLQS
jgi:two-component system response regulator AlgR